MSEVKVDTISERTAAGGVTIDGVLVKDGTATFQTADGSPLVFEGATADAYETTFAITDPTADRTITFPDSSFTVPTSGGTILQVVQPAAITSNTVTTTSTSFVDITGITLSITPTLVTSKVLVSFVLQIGVNTGWHANFRLMRDSTPIAIGDSYGSRKQSTGDVGYNISMLNVGTSQFLDAPATTSAITYKVQWATETSGTIYLNRGHGYTDNANFGTGISTITAMEIGV